MTRYIKLLSMFKNSWEFGSEDLAAMSTNDVLPQRCHLRDGRDVEVEKRLEGNRGFLSISAPQVAKKPGTRPQLVTS